MKIETRNWKLEISPKFTEGKPGEHQISKF